MATYPGCRGTALQRFWKKVDRSGDCWLWTAGKTRDGYGCFRPEKTDKTMGAHRWAFQTFVGEIPDGEEIHHTCTTRNCVNPDHLQTVSHERNMYEGRTLVCRNGHERPPGKTCPVCAREASRRYYQKQKAAR